MIINLKISVTDASGLDSFTLDELWKFFVEFCGEGNASHGIGEDKEIIMEALEITETELP